MPRSRWHGFIKDYDGGTLMECFIHPKIDYLHIPEMLDRQRRHLRDRIKKICGASIEYPGLSADERRNFLQDPYSMPGILLFICVFIIYTILYIFEMICMYSFFSFDDNIYIFRGEGGWLGQATANA